MPGLHSTQPEAVTATSGAQNPDSPALHLRVVPSAPDRGEQADLLDQFETALGCGDLSRARDALLKFRDHQHSEHGRLQQTKNELVQAVGELQQLLDERCRTHHAELNLQKQQLTEWHEQEKQALISESRRAVSKIQSAREKWQSERNEEAVILAGERTRLDHAEETLQSGRDALKRQGAELAAERAALTGELNTRRSEFENQLAQEHEERQSLLNEARLQKETEWEEHQSQLNHEMETQRSLHDRQLSLDRESFLRACADREDELDLIRTELDQQREQLVDERCRSAEQFAQSRQQIEHDRKLLQDGLRQMDSQLRWVASSLSLNGGPPPTAHTAAISHAADSGEQPVSSPSRAPAQPARTDTTGEQTSAAAGFAPDGSSPIDEFVDQTAGNQPVTGWIGVVSPSGDEPAGVSPETETAMPPAAPGTDSDAVDDERRLRLEEYRSQLSTLQASLSSLQNSSTGAPATDSSSPGSEITP